MELPDTYMCVKTDELDDEWILRCLLELKKEGKISLEEFRSVLADSFNL